MLSTSITEFSIRAAQDQVSIAIFASNLKAKELLYKVNSKTPTQSLVAQDNRFKKKQPSINDLKTGFKKQTKDLMKTHNHDIIALVETKIKTNRAQQIIQSLKILTKKISPAGFSKWILLLWSSNVIEIICTSNTFVDVKIA